MKGSALRRLLRDHRGASIIEFGLVTPVFVVLGFTGLEAANMALTQLRLSQISSNLADTASRIGDSSALSLKKIRESDINDAFQAVRLQAGSTPLTSRGRVILSSLERNAADGQFIRWQRCLGKGNYSSAYTSGLGKLDKSFPGMGLSGNLIQAPPGSAVMYVEVIYRYKPMLSKVPFGEPLMKSRAAFLVRDPRDLAAAANPTPIGSAMTCNLFTD